MKIPEANLSEWQAYQLGLAQGTAIRLSARLLATHNAGPGKGELASATELKEAREIIQEILERIELVTSSLSAEAERRGVSTNP